MGHFVRWRNLELFAIGGDGVIGFPLLLQFYGEIAVGARVIGIYLNLLAKSANSFIAIVESRVSASQIVPCIFLGRVLIKGALQQSCRRRKVLALQCGRPSLSDLLGRACRIGRRRNRRRRGRRDAAPEALLDRATARG